MSMINLIANERAQRRKQQGRTRIMGFFWLGMVVLAVGGYFFAALYIASIESKTRALDAELQELEPARKQIAKLEGEIARLTPQLATLVAAQSDTGRWQRILTHISFNSPEFLWLHTIRTNERAGSTGPYTLTLGGTAASQQLVGEFMLRLNNCPDLERIELKFTQEKTLDAWTNAVDFEVSALIKGTELPTPNEKKEGAHEKS